MLSAQQNIKTFTLVMLMTGAIDSIRNLPTTALFGSSIIFYLFLSALIFLIPVSLVSAELSASFDNKGGVYVWVKEAFGDHLGFLTIWLQWVNTLVWFPTILSFIAATLTYLINPVLANDRFFMTTVILITFWLLTFICLKGLKTSAVFASFCTVIGVLIPMLFIIFLGLKWSMAGNHLEIMLDRAHLIPTIKQSDSWISLTAIITAFLGIELSSVHINHVNKPKVTFPLAIAISAVLIITTMLAGSLAIAAVIPSHEINLVNGVIEAFDSYLKKFHLHFLTYVVIAILLGSLGQIINWVISPAKGLLQAADDGYLPGIFDKRNQYDVPYVILLVQALLVSIICAAFLLMPSVNGSYWLLTDLSTELYVMMYLIMFIAAIVLKYKNPHRSNTFNIPGAQYGMYITSVVGIIGCLIALVVGFFPPSDINVGSTLHYEIVFSLGIILMILPIFIFYIYKKMC